MEHGQHGKLTAWEQTLTDTPRIGSRIGHWSLEAWLAVEHKRWSLAAQEVPLRRRCGLTVHLSNLCHIHLRASQMIAAASERRCRNASEVKALAEGSPHAGSHMPLDHLPNLCHQLHSTARQSNRLDQTTNIQRTAKSDLHLSRRSMNPTAASLLPQRHF